MKPEDKISKELKVIARALDKKLENVAGIKMGFSLMIWNSEADGRMNYISNCNRGDIKKAFSELLAKWETEGGPPSHEFN